MAHIKLLPLLALLVFFDVIVMMLSEEMGISKEEMEARHRNIE